MCSGKRDSHGNGDLRAKGTTNLRTNHRTLDWSGSRSQAWRAVNQFQQATKYAQTTCGQLVNLVTASLPAYAPLAEVFAVIFQRVVAILTESQAGPMDHILSVEVACLLRPDPDLAPSGKLRKRNLLNWASTQPA